MQRAQKLKNRRRRRRALGIRRRVRGTAEQPRLTVFRSVAQIYVQAIDDRAGVTLAAASSVDKDLRGNLSGTKSEQAKAVGAELARRLTEKGVQRAVFDRGWYRFHGRVKALAEGAREGGLQF